MLITVAEREERRETMVSQRPKVTSLAKDAIFLLRAIYRTWSDVII